MNFISKILLPFIVVVTLHSCHQKQVVVGTSNSTEDITIDNTFNSFIEGKVIARYKAGENYDSKYQEHFSFADVMIIKILQKGQNFHGQFNEGDTIRIFFNFTMKNTDKLFPELNTAMPGLKENDVFQAELKEKESTTQPFSVYLYKLKES